MSAPIANARPQPDRVLADIADYVLDFEVTSEEAFRTARHCLMDTLGCGFEALAGPGRMTPFLRCSTGSSCLAVHCGIRRPGLESPHDVRRIGAVRGQFQAL